jgi:hypothetical protein
MAEIDSTNYNETLQQILIARKDWLEKSELVRLKDALRSFQSSFASLYNIYLKKKLINEDPYKQESKISELEVPETGTLVETKKIEQLSLRLSNFDSQLDFLVNFYQLGVDFLNLERIKRILGLVRFIDWANLTPDSQSVNTRAVAEMTNLCKVGVDQITLSIIGESLTRLSKTTATVIGILKDLTVYYKESYKLNVRNTVTRGMSASEANSVNIKKKFPAAMSGTPFYQDLIEELIKEDYSKNGPEMKEAILKALRLADEKPKAAKAVVNFKNTLLEGIHVIGGSNSSMNEIGTKLDENAAVYASQKKSFWEKLRQVIRQMVNSEPEKDLYELEYMDQTKGVMVKEKLNFHQFREDMDKKIKILASFANGPAAVKLAAMTEEQIIGYLEKNIRDVQTFHKTLSALDDFFKSKTPSPERESIKGIKPELAALKNSFVRANQLRHEYSAQKEEEEQMKRLCISPATE